MYTSQSGKPTYLPWPIKYDPLRCASSLILS
jgi:hypothetical protein